MSAPLDAGDGYRFLDADEKMEPLDADWPMLEAIECWVFGSWIMGGYYGAAPSIVYRTQPSRSALAALRAGSPSPQQRLEAAAPELLAALREIAAVWDDLDDHHSTVVADFEKAYNIAKAAIAKATGEAL